MTAHPPLPSTPPGYASAAVGMSVRRLERGASRAEDVTLAQETPVAIVVNGETRAVMLATPADLEDFALGFVLTEGILASPLDVEALDIVRTAIGIECQIVSKVALPSAGRTLPGRTGCGLCGRAELAGVLPSLPPLVARPHYQAPAILRAMQSLEQSQPLNAVTGAMHAAALATASGALVATREDVGRHNALDKLLGATAGASHDAHFVVMSSRASVELVQKCVRRGIPLLATVSAPTALAVRVAHDAGLALAGFARANRITLYAHGDRVQ